MLKNKFKFLYSKTNNILPRSRIPSCFYGMDIHVSGMRNPHIAAVQNLGQCISV